jgi:hypothetical protein
MGWEADQVGFDYENAGYIIDENVSAGNIRGAFIAHKYNVGIGISLEHGNTRSRVLLSLSDATAICEKARYQYLNHFRTSFPVSAEAMAIELILHADVDFLVPLVNNKFVDWFLPKSVENLIDSVKRSSKSADININDAQRKYDSVAEGMYTFLETPSGMTLIF